MTKKEYPEIDSATQQIKNFVDLIKPFATNGYDVEVNQTIQGGNSKLIITITPADHDYSLD